MDDPTAECKAALKPLCFVAFQCGCSFRHLQQAGKLAVAHAQLHQIRSRKPAARRERNCALPEFQRKGGLVIFFIELAVLVSFRRPGAGFVIWLKGLGQKGLAATGMTTTVVTYSVGSVGPMRATDLMAVVAALQITFVKVLWPIEQCHTICLFNKQGVVWGNSTC